MGERLSTMSIDELQDTRKDLISKLKQVNDEIAARMESESRSLQRNPSSASSKTSAAGSGSGSSVVVKKKKVTISDSNESRPASAAAAAATPTKVVKKAAGAASGSASSATASKSENIKATIADMKAVLDNNGITYGSTAKKDELIALVRANHLIRKAEQRCQDRKKASAGASAENSD